MSTPTNGTGFPTTTSASIDDAFVYLGGTGMQGLPGGSIELRTTATEIQWRQTGGPEGDSDWKTVTTLTELATQGVAPTLLPGTTKILPWTEPATAEIVKDGPGAYHIDFGIPAGEPGPEGQPRYHGTGPPSVVPVGAHPGDLYLDTDRGIVYQLL